MSHQDADQLPPANSSMDSAYQLNRGATSVSSFLGPHAVTGWSSNTSALVFTDNSFSIPGARLGSVALRPPKLTTLAMATSGSPIPSTISRDNTAGECAHRADLLAYFGKKIRHRPGPAEDPRPLPIDSNNSWERDRPTRSSVADSMWGKPSPEPDELNKDLSGWDEIIPADPISVIRAKEERSMHDEYLAKAMGMANLQMDAAPTPAPLMQLQQNQRIRATSMHNGMTNDPQAIYNSAQQRLITQLQQQRLIMQRLQEQLQLHLEEIQNPEATMHQYNQVINNMHKQNQIQQLQMQNAMQRQAAMGQQNFMGANSRNTNQAQPLFALQQQQQQKQHIFQGQRPIQPAIMYQISTLTQHIFNAQLPQLVVRFQGNVPEEEVERLRKQCATAAQSQI